MTGVAMRGVFADMEVDRKMTEEQAYTLYAALLLIRSWTHC